MIKSVCIVGGGTSGCISALIIKQAYPNMDITLLESSRIGIIGVGEGSTEHWKKFIQHVGITVPDLVRECDATFKIGIKFTNWHGDDTHYFHSLSEQFGIHSEANGWPTTWLRMVGENCDPLATAWQLSMQSRHVEPLHDVIAQYHFDTNKLNQFLHKVCIERGITIVDTEVEQVILDDQGNVSKLIDITNNSFTSDFFIDCSGFRRVIGSKLDAKWIDCQHQLPMNSAIAFPTEYTEEIPSYTEATALGSGWCWRIPTQQRYGNGYVFCDSFINETQAFDEVEQHYKKNLKIAQPLEIGKKIKFGAGYVEKFWLKNCVMVGLSGIFVEPLEASSIGTTIQQIMLLCPNLMSYQKNDLRTAKIYNDYMRVISENVIDFIQLHYMSQRNDTEFWRWCHHGISLTDFNSQYLDYFKENFSNLTVFATHPMNLFSYLNFAQVMHGLRMFDTKKIKSTYDYHFSHYTPESNRVIESCAAACETVETYTHREALEILKDRFREQKHNF